MAYSTWGLTYDDACALIELLKEHGITSNITAGGIAIHPEGDTQISKMKAACRAYGTTAIEGNTPHQDRVLERKVTDLTEK
jgi:hypothetical protein